MGLSNRRGAVGFPGRSCEHDAYDERTRDQESRAFPSISMVPRATGRESSPYSPLRRIWDMGNARKLFQAFRTA